MPKLDKRTMILTSIVTLLPMLIGAALWKRLPDVMATHFDLNNEANGFSSKLFTVVGLPLFLLAMQWIVATVTVRDPRKQNISSKILRMCLWIVPVTSMLCAGAIYPYNLGMKLNMSLLSGVVTGLLFIVIGNYLPKTRQNYSIGIRLPWTLADTDNWNRTHRLAGHLWAAGGFVLIFLSLTGRLHTAVLLVWIAVMIILPCLYSWLLYGKKKG